MYIAAKLRERGTEKSQRMKPFLSLMFNVRYRYRYRHSQANALSICLHRSSLLCRRAENKWPLHPGRHPSRRKKKHLKRACKSSMSDCSVEVQYIKIYTAVMHLFLGAFWSQPIWHLYPCVTNRWAAKLSSLVVPKITTRQSSCSNYSFERNIILF